MNVEATLKEILESDGKERVNHENDLINLGTDAIRPLLGLLSSGDDIVRLSLSLLVRVCKTSKNSVMAKKMMDLPAHERLHELLSHKDQKIRKNAALFLMKTGGAHDVPPLAKALGSEDVRFVRVALIQALAGIGGETAHTALKEAYDNLDESISGDEAIHFEKEKRSLENAIGLHNYTANTFNGFKGKRQVFLTAPRGLENALEDEAKEHGISFTQTYGGIKTVTGDYAALFKLRCFNEALIPLCAAYDDPVHTADELLKAGLLSLLDETYAGGPYTYRVEIKRVLNSVRIPYAKALCKALSNEQLINSTSGYGIELRVDMAEKRAYLKLCSFPDDRFSYRAGSTPASINPVTAAGVTRLAKQFLKTDADILDPFCGSGTMLIERAKAASFASLTGVDIYGKALVTAKENLSLAHLTAKLIRTDIRSFKGKTYDEIISNMPFGNRVGSHDLNTALYRAFFNMLPSLMRKGGVAILYTMEKKLAKSCIAENGAFKLIKRHVINSGGLDPALFIIKVL